MDKNQKKPNTKQSIFLVEEELENNTTPSYLKKKKEREIKTEDKHMGNRCSICLDYEKYSTNLIQCNKCMSYFHEKCYSKYIPEELLIYQNIYTCNLCKKGKFNEICHLCKQQGGILKKVWNKYYVHNYCYFFFKEFFDGNSTDLRKIRYSHKCTICNKKLDNVPTIECMSKKCKRYYHIKCAINNKLIFSIEYFKDFYKTDFNKPLTFNCNLHNSQLVKEYTEYIQQLDTVLDIDTKKDTSNNNESEEHKKKNKCKSGKADKSSSTQIKFISTFNSKLNQNDNNNNKSGSNIINNNTQKKKVQSSTNTNNNKSSDNNKSENKDTNNNNQSIKDNINSNNSDNNIKSNSETSHIPDDTTSICINNNNKSSITISTNIIHEKTNESEPNKNSQQDSLNNNTQNNNNEKEKNEDNKKKEPENYLIKEAESKSINTILENNSTKQTYYKNIIPREKFFKIKFNFDSSKNPNLLLTNKSTKASETKKEENSSSISQINFEKD